jgi:hypothetical protein
MDEFERDQLNIERYKRTGKINCRRGDGKFNTNDSTCRQCTTFLVCAMKEKGF